ncbi:hypothetical protein [Pseudonocardia endophytica]|uniref:Uncharacterized protein n=1 Tax=Pseudonocardia endophytica TaxID=401976 RepID=A0A4R1HG17_PSEEN|nr:hypothetical protein [Pseudonocardia endophytica]TCK20628.1 hypothetical protein EV378_4589 [Pseudonocardia endophytica]
MYVARTPYAHGPGETPTGIAVRLAEQFIGRLNYLIMAVGAQRPTEDTDRAARALRLEQLHTRQARWWAVLQRHTDHRAVAVVYVDAVIRARSKAEDDARFWRDAAADWTARALDLPTSDCAGAMSNWDDLGVTDLGRPHLAETVPPVPSVGALR